MEVKTGYWKQTTKSKLQVLKLISWKKQQNTLRMHCKQIKILKVLKMEPVFDNILKYKIYRI
jgi:hypothetical protein